MKKVLFVMSALFLITSLSTAQAGDFSISGEQFAKASTRAVVQADPVMTAKINTGSGIWLSLYTGYDFANLGSLGVDEKNLNEYAKSLGDPNADGIDGSGILGGLALGLDLDKSNALSLSLENTWTAQSGLNITSGHDSGIHQRFDPSLLGIALNYELVIAQGGGSKTTLIVGAGYYHGAVHYDSSIASGPGQEITGDFGQDGVGGTFGVSEKLNLTGSLDLGFTARFRAADFGKLTSNEVTDNGTTSSSGGPFVLVSDTVNQPYTNIYPVPTSSGPPPSGYHYTDLDYTGFNANLSLTLHL